MGIGALVFFTVFKLATMVLFVFLWTYVAPWQLATNAWWSWPLLFIVVDLAWYLNHRFSHRVRIGWAAHQAHQYNRMFGTFQRELHTPTYGLTKPVGTYNVFKLQYHEYGSIIADVRAARRWRDRLGCIFGPPGWQPRRSADGTETAAESTLVTG